MAVGVAEKEGCDDEGSEQVVDDIVVSVMVSRASNAEDRGV